MWCRLGIFGIRVKLGLWQWVEWKWVFWMPHFLGERYRKIYKTGNVKLGGRKLFCGRVILLRKIFVQVFGTTRKKFSFLGFLGKRLGILGIWPHPVPPQVDLAHLFGFMTQSSISTPSGSKSRFLSNLDCFLCRLPTVATQKQSQVQKSL